MIYFNYLGITSHEGADSPEGKSCWKSETFDSMSSSCLEETKLVSGWRVMLCVTKAMLTPQCRWRALGAQFNQGNGGRKRGKGGENEGMSEGDKAEGVDGGGGGRAERKAN